MFLIEPENFLYLINFGILVCNEADRLQQLLDNLKTNKVPFNQLIVVIDSQNTSQEVKKIVDENQLIYYFKPFITTCDQRNFLKDKCWLPYIFFIDVDELLGAKLLEEALRILAGGIQETLALPRANIIIQDVPIENRYGLEQNKDGFFGWPDFQAYRILKNLPHLRFTGKGHDVLTITSCELPSLPPIEDFALIHTKKASEFFIRDELWRKLDGTEGEVLIANNIEYKIK